MYSTGLHWMAFNSFILNGLLFTQVLSSGTLLAATGFGGADLGADPRIRLFGKLFPTICAMYVWCLH